jgi:hypothetical protein
MATDKELEDKRSRLKAQEEFYNPKNTAKPEWFYKHGRKNSDDAAYASAKVRADMVEQEQEARMNKPNSRAQYQHEQEQGDPNALRMSYEEWKKL